MLARIESVLSWPMKPSSMVPFTKPMAAIVRLLIFAARTIPATWADQRPAHEAPREPEGPQRSAGLEAARLFESEAAARSQRSRRGHNRAADGYAGAAPVQVRSPVAGDGLRLEGERKRRHGSEAARERNGGSGTHDRQIGR